MNMTYKTDQLTLQIVEEVAANTNSDPLELSGRLYDAIDPDALERLFFDRNTTGEVRFEFEGQVVTVYADGEIVSESNQSPSISVESSESHM